MYEGFYLLPTLSLFEVNQQKQLNRRAKPPCATFNRFFTSFHNQHFYYKKQDQHNTTNNNKNSKRQNNQRPDDED